MMIRLRLIFFVCSLFVIRFSFAQFNIIPQPVEINYSKAHNVIIDSTFEIEYYSSWYEDEAILIQDYFKSFHNLELGIKYALDKNSNESNSKNKITLGFIDTSINYQNGGYTLNITPGNIAICGTEQGTFYAIQTLMQITFQNLNLQSCMIKDYPRFQWRGMHLDVSRHFFDKEFIKKYIDLLAMYKMNVFHWHLTDDQGWRIEIKKYPKLTEVGAWRNGSMIGHYNEQKFDNIRYGGFYTQEEIKEVVAYAKSKHITIVPEIEMPGHAVAALAAYPEYSCTGGPFEVEKSWGVFDDVFCVGNDSTFIFLQNILDEVCELFPGEYIHIGGDECPKTRWEKCEKCNERMKNEELNNEHELQSYFIQRIEKYLNKKGKKIIGWDEILEGGLAPNAAVMSWRGEAGGIAAAKEKHFVVMTPGSHCYFDHYQGNPRFEPLAIGGNTTLEKVYSYEPVPKELTEEEAKYILGAQGNVWTEYMGTENQIEYMVLPRILALSEVLWSLKNKNDYSYFKKRVQFNLSILSKLDYNFKFLDTQNDFKIKMSEKGIVVQANFDTTLSKASYGLGEIMNLKEKPNFIPYNSSGIRITGPCQIWWKIESYDTTNKYRESTSFPIYISKSTSKKISFSTPPSKHYNTNTDFTLVNGIKGFYPKINSEWLAWQGEDVEMIIDLEKKQNISEINVGTLIEPQSWIYLTSELDVSFSNNGKKYSKAKIEVKDFESERKRNIRINFKSTKKRFVKIKLKNPGIIQEGNPGAGNPSWMFFDEIMID